MYWTDRYWTDMYWTNVCRVYVWYMRVCDIVSGCVYACVHIHVHVCVCVYCVYMFVTLCQVYSLCVRVYACV